MSRQSLSKIEQNQQKIEEETLVILAKELDTTPEKIKSYKNDGPMMENSHNQQVDVQQYNSCVIQMPEQVWTTINETLEANRGLLLLQGETLRSHMETMRINGEALKSCTDTLHELMKTYQQLAALRGAP